mgnify:CR=1 FL=1
MPSFRNTKILPYTDKQLYNIIIDVESYPEFLPWCKDSEIISKIDENNFDAMLTIGYKALDENYTSRVKGIYLKQIESIAVTGPFKYLDSIWIFKKSGKSCQVTFTLNYEFKSFFLAKIMGAIFQKASEKMFSAFESRAKELYI